MTVLRDVLVFFLFFLHTSASITESPVERDVCIIGGGSSGTYAAIRLQQLGYSVAVIEKQARLGGHVNTFHDPVSGEYFDFGVSIYEDISVVTEYFAALNVTLGPPSAAASLGIYANLKTDGKAVEIPESLTWTNQTEVGEAFVEYASILEQYPYLNNGFDLPQPVPEELLMPWGDFLEEHSLSALSFTSYLYNQGIGNILAQPTLYVMKYFSSYLVRVLLGESGVGFVASATNGNQELYDHALEQLGDDAFLSTIPTAIRRSDDGVEVDIYSNTSGKSMTIQANKLLIAVEPTLSNIQGLGLDITSIEKELFQQFNNSYYWDAVIKATGAPSDTGFFNIDLDTPYGIPALPALYTFGAVTGTTDLFTGYFGSPSYLSDDEVKLTILNEVSKALNANGYNTTAAPEILAFNNHSPFELTVSPESIRNGFYDQLNSLQGANNTWWTGAAWQAQDSSQIWNWTEYTLLPRIVASL